MKKGVIAVLACVFALSLALVGCSGGSGSSGSNVNAAWIGTWDLVEMDDNGQKTTSEDLELLKSLGMDVYLQLSEDGKSALVLFGESIEGTWEAKSATEAAFTREGESVVMTLDGEKLSMTQNGSTLVFKKGEDRSASSASASAGAASSSASAAASSSAASSGSAPI